MINFGVTEQKAEELRRRMADCGLQEEDLEERFVRSGGPGGQKVNKSSTCVYLKHRPSGQEVKMQKSRRQGLNRFYARRRMCELLEEADPNTKSTAAVKREKIRKQKDRRRRRRKKGAGGNEEVKSYKLQVTSYKLQGKKTENDEFRILNDD